MGQQYHLLYDPAHMVWAAYHVAVAVVVAVAVSPVAVAVVVAVEVSPAAVAAR